MANGKRLYRNTDKGIVGGVLAGLADYLNQDVVLWRVLAIILFILTGLMPGLLVYVVAWIVIPAKPATEPHYDYEAE